MFNPTEVLIDAFGEQLRAGYRRMYGGLKPDYEDIICWAGGLSLENIANSDALYHNVEHTILVTLVGQEILRGKHMKEGGVTPEDWLLYIISLLCHDIGFVRGICRQDRRDANQYATGKEGQMASLPEGCSDASLNPWHVDRGKLFIRERLAQHKLIDPDVICCNIELTRFPVPDGSDHKGTSHFPGLLRAADLIGQLSDLRYLRKSVALFYEFEEIGTNRLLGYRTPGELRAGYPKFYWRSVYPYVRDALGYLALSQEGKQIVANLYAHVFAVEHGMADDSLFRQEFLGA
jgi:hypothetical protein